MKNFKNPIAKLLLVAFALIGMGIVAQPTYANCLIAVTYDNGNTGFVSCGSTAGNYEAELTSSGWVTRDADFLTNVLCFLEC
ncbi:MAG TPA: hypothetical protein VF791_15420 [Pyrinomonadaceae bacterium]